MTGGNDRPLHRRIAIVSQLKAGEALSSATLASLLGKRGIHACPKTVQRDVQEMQLDLDAPIEYEPNAHGYRLTDTNWTFPTKDLEDDALFVSLVAQHLAAPLLPPLLQEPLSQAERVLLSTGSAEDISDDLLRSVIQATSGKILPDDTVFEDVLDAWRDSRVLAVRYRNESGVANSRQIEPHALFLAAGAWYIRGHCRLRREVRSFAIHRCHDTKVLDEHFQRSPAILAGLKEGDPFDYREAHNVVLRATPHKASVLREREWFPGQTIEEHPDGSLTLRFASAPEPLILRWILSYAPHITVIAPHELRTTVRNVAAQLCMHHAGDSNPTTPTQN